MGVNKFDASSLEVTMDQTLVGQGVNASAMGLQAPSQQQNSTPTAPAQTFSLSSPGRG